MKFLVCVLFFFVLSIPAKSENVLNLYSDRCDFRVQDSYFEYYTDSSGEQTIESIRQQVFNPDFNPAKLQTGIHYWLRLKVKNNSTIQKEWYLQTSLHSELSEIYVFQKDSMIADFHAGQLLPFDARAIKVRTNLLNLRLSPDSLSEVYFHFYWGKYPDNAVIISDSESYLEVNTRAYLFVGLIYGFLILMLVYNLMLYFSVREKLYLYYTFYIIASIFLLLWKDGIGFQYLWPSLPDINHHHHRWAMFLVLIASILYTLQFLEVPLNERKYKVLVVAILSMNGVYLSASYFVSNYFNVLPIPYLISYLFLIGICIYWMKKKIVFARYLLISLVSITSAFVIMKLRYSGILEWNWFFEYILNYAIALDALVMSWAIRDKLSVLRYQKDEREKAIALEERLLIEHKLVQLKNENLEREIQHQNQELAMMVSMEAHKIEYMQNLKENLEEVLKENPGLTNLKKIIKQFDQGDFELKWDKFRINFDKANNNILSRLEIAQPKLKQSDLLFCAYLLMNKSNKELASMLNISVSGVEKRQMRLKEKLQISISIQDYLSNFRRGE
jgi:hypothetical protein